MVRVTDEELRMIRLKVSMANEARCRVVDDDGCRCLCRPHGHRGGHDFPWTRWDQRENPTAAEVTAWT